jgi:nucleotide sugar dehydrogenase
MLIGIIGYGFVGQATSLLKCKGIDILIYDVDETKSTVNCIDELIDCEILFISVPTPTTANNECNISIIESIMNKLREINYINFVVIRSTVPPGTCDKLKCYFMPEFLTEKNYENDFVNNEHWIFGMLDDCYVFKEKIKFLIDTAYNNNKIKYNSIVLLPNKEAELIKYFRNSFLATKVAFCNEIYELCNKININYEHVRQYATMDKRINESHTHVPGHDGKMGFGGTCFPKDIRCLKNEYDKHDLHAHILNAVIDRNTYDRPEEEWMHNNRSFMN